MFQLDGIQLGFMVGAVPTFSMALSSFALSNVTVSKKFEGILQNFVAGLILAAVAGELFPLLIDNVTVSETWIGVTVGFVFGLGVQKGMETLIDFLVSDEDDNGEGHEDGYHPMHSPEFASSHLFQKLSGKAEDFSIEGAKYEFRELYQAGARLEWEEEAVQQASLAIAQPGHRQHLRQHIQEVVESIGSMEQRCEHLLTKSISLSESEEMAERIDESIHSLQYQLDHCRRLLQGSEAELSGGVVKSWVTEERKRTMQRRLELLRLTGEHLLEHLQEDSITVDKLKEMHQHMSDMDRLLVTFHDSVENVASRWIRRNREMPEPSLGAPVPVGLVVPVTLDCFTDGLLIGVTCALNPTAGIVLGFANCLEMGTLGMAYSVRLKKCTGSSWTTRQVALYAPPVLMFLAAGLGALVADSARDLPAVFVSFVAFGVVALLSLVCNELIVEAREALGSEDSWYGQLALFGAVYLVLMVSPIL